MKGFIALNWANSDPTVQTAPDLIKFVWLLSPKAAIQSIIRKRPHQAETGHKWPLVNAAENLFTSHIYAHSRIAADIHRYIFGYPQLRCQMIGPKISEALLDGIQKFFGLAHRESLHHSTRRYRISVLAKKGLIFDA